MSGLDGADAYKDTLKVRLSAISLNSGDKSVRFAESAITRPAMIAISEIRLYFWLSSGSETLVVPEAQLWPRKTTTLPSG